MEGKGFPDILMKSPFGYANHKLLLGSDGEPVDYVFLEVNPAFEKMTGLKKEDILGKRATEVLPGLRTSGFDWVEAFGKVALTGEKKEFIQYSDPLERWYKVAAYSLERGFFITAIHDNTEEMQRIEALENQKEKIKELANELETVYNGTQDAMFMVRVDGDDFRYISNNAAYRKLTGLSQEDVKGKTPVEIMGKEVGEITKANFKKCIEAKSPITYEETLDFPAGTKTWISTLTPVIENGEVKYLVCSRKDITLQKTAEIETEQLNKRLRTMFNEHSAIMLLLEPLSGKIVDVNPAACAFYGYTKEEFSTMYIQDINMLPPKKLKKARLDALYENKTYYLFPHRLKSGVIKPVDIYTCPVKDQERTLLFSIIFDATEREEYRHRLFQEKELLRVTLESIGDGTVATDYDGKITLLNKAAEEITGWSKENAVGESFDSVFQLVNEETGKRAEDPVAKVIRTGKVVGLANHTTLITKDGNSVPVADSAAPIKDEKGQTLGVVMVFRDVSAEKEHQKQIIYLSYHDYLTGLYNRRFMEEEIKRMDTSRQLPIAVIMGDLNGLKLTNDVFGHSVGDQILKKAAKAIKDSCRREDIIARWGGDEFLVILPKTSQKTAEKIVQRIKSKSASDTNEPFQVSIALGIALKEKDSQTSLYEVIKEAEEAMYHQKYLEGKSHRNAVINTLAATLFAKSMETKEHADRLKSLCLRMGKELDLQTKELDQLEILAMLHDIGKVGIDESILQKPGPLSPEEWVEIKKHPEIGFRIAHNTPELVSVAEYILSHHERWDGEGYPQGLKGEEIPLLARVLAVADAFDAMTSDRKYRKAMDRKKAISEIKKNSGTQFDPEVVSVFLKIMKAS